MAEYRKSLVKVRTVYRTVTRQGASKSLIMPHQERQIAEMTELLVDALGQLGEEFVMPLDKRPQPGLVTVAENQPGDQGGRKAREKKHGQAHVFQWELSWAL